jgi:hypothetical protein
VANVGLESLARGCNLAAYDAAYLDLALRAVVLSPHRMILLQMQRWQKGITVLE